MLNQFNLLVKLFFIMKLLYTLNSPYARKVRIVAAEKHIEMELEEVVLGAADSMIMQYNPLAKVPVLVLYGEDSLYDSRVIVEYLDNRTPLAYLIPRDVSSRIKVRRWEALADGVCDAIVAIVMEQRRPLEMQHEAFMNRQMNKVTLGLQVLNNDLGKNRWCVNDTFSLADVAVGCMLGYLNLRLNEVIKLSTDYINLDRLNMVLSKRKSFIESMPVT